MEFGRRWWLGWWSAKVEWVELVVEMNGGSGVIGGDGGVDGDGGMK